MRANFLDVVAQLFDDGEDVGGAFDEIEIALRRIENRELIPLDRLLDWKADRFRLGDHVLRPLIGDQNAGLLMLEAAGEELQSDEALADAAAAFDDIDVIRHEDAGLLMLEAAGEELQS